VSKVKRPVALLLQSALLLLGPAVTGMAQTEHITPFTGTWELQVAKSSFDPGPPFRSFTLTFTPDGTRNLHLIYADGQPLRAALPWSDGKEVHVQVIEGVEAATVVSKIEGDTFHDTWKRDGKVIERVHGAVSPDGKKLTIRVEGPTKQGGTFHNRLQFDKQ
jgi:hypothetical protein